MINVNDERLLISAVYVRHSDDKKVAYIERLFMISSDLKLKDVMHLLEVSLSDGCVLVEDSIKIKNPDQQKKILDISSGGMIREIDWWPR